MEKVLKIDKLEQTIIIIKLRLKIIKG